MKKRFRFLSTLLIAVMAWSLYAAAFATAEETGGISVYIPNKIARLHLPDMPEYIALFTRTQSVATYGNPDDPSDPCPILPVNEPDIDLFFSERPDWAAVIWPEGTEYISVNENGYARVSSAGHKTQPGVTAGTMLIKDEKTGKTKRVWAATTADHVAGEDAPAGDGAFLAGKNGVTVLYNRDGSPVWVEYTIHDDFYKTGIYGAVTTVRYERVVISGDRYIYELDENGHYIYEPEMKLKKTLKNGQYETVLDDYGNPVYEPTGKMVKKKHNLKGNVVIITLDDKKSYYIDTYEYTKFDFSEEGLGIFDGIVTLRDGYVNIKIYTPTGEYVDELNIDNDDFVALTKKNHLNLKNYPNAVSGNDSYIHFYYTTWYISQVVTEYPDDVNYIVRVESDWKNNSGQFLWGYKITYATSAKERYKITYMPNTTTILEDHGTNKFYEWDDPTYPSTDLEAYFEAMGAADASEFHGMYLHHYEEDTPIYGEYTDGTLNLVSGSGDYLPYWYEEGHGARVYKRLYPCTYFSTPRYK